MARPRTGRQTSAEYQRRYRERKKAQQALAQTNWMLDARLTDAIREEAKSRGIRESQLAAEILERWYEARFGGALPPLEEPAAPTASMPQPEPEVTMNALTELLLGKLEALGFVIPLQGTARQCLRGDADNGLTATVALNDATVIEFGLTERVDGAICNVLHCVVDTMTRRAWLSSEAYLDLNGERDVDARGLNSLADVFDRLRDFIMARRRPLRLEQIMTGLPGCLGSPLPRTLLARVFQRVGLELVYLPPLGTPREQQQLPEVALHDLAELASYARREMLRTGNDLCRIELDDGSELLVFPTEARALVHAATGVREPAVATGARS